jgi:hypothetical protein
MTGPGAALTVAEAAAWLDPPITARQLGELITTLRVAHAGRRPSTGGRPPQVYDAAELMRLHAAVTPWLLAAEPAPMAGCER